MSGSSGKLSRALRAAGVTGLLVALALVARADDGTAVDQIVSVLREKGLIDQATGDEILAKQAKADAEQVAKAKATPPVAQGLLEGFIFSGDLRLRDEQFWYSNSALGPDAANDNNRIRYRARFGFTKQITDYALVGVRLVSDTTDYRSTNVSAGENSDFNYDSVFFDRLYAQVQLPDPGIGLKTQVTAGKMANPFIWKNGMDKILWDDDIAPEGVSLTSTWSPNENAKLYATFGYYIELQNSSQVDPRVFAYQAGGSMKLPGAVEAGARVSYYDWNHLGADATTAARTGYFARSAANGNLANAFDPDMRVIESSGYVTFAPLEEWPTTVWGTWAENLSADGATIAGVFVGAEDQAYGFGVEAGDAKRLLRLGVAYNYVEANAVPAQYTDSDMFDGRTNRRGFAIYGFREVWTNTELRLTFWDGHPIRTTNSGGGAGPFNISTTTDSQADRLRMQADLNFKF
jgi:hypothetical protein